MTVKRRLGIVLPLIALLPVAWAAAAPVRSTHQANLVTAPVLPNFACSDQSYANAVKNGITLGISPDPPYTSENPQTNAPGGIDVAINQLVLHRIGVTKIKYSLMPFASLIPALQSNRIDVATENVHETPDRNKVINFTSPAWWYGPVLVVKKGNPQHITSFADLKKPGVKVGLIAGYASQEYFDKVHIKYTPFQDTATQYLALKQGKISAVVEDSPQIAYYTKAHPNSGLTWLSVSPPSTLVQYGWSYARYGLRKSDCTLNFAYSRALDELRANGQIGHLLKVKFGLSPTQNVWMPAVLAGGEAR